MAKIELFTPNELIKSFDNGPDYIVIFQPKRPTEKRTTIHKSSCDHTKNHYKLFYGSVLDKKFDPSNGQKYYRCNSYKEIKIDFPESNPCGICKPST